MRQQAIGLLKIGAPRELFDALCRQGKTYVDANGVETVSYLLKDAHDPDHILEAGDVIGYHVVFDANGNAITVDEVFDLN